VEWGVLSPTLLRALVTSLLVSVSCAVIGVFVVLRGLSFMGAGVAHAAFSGSAMAILLGVNPLAGALVFSILLAVVAGYTGLRGRVKMDVAIGAFFAFSMALGILFISMTPGYVVRAWWLIMGDVLGVSDWDLLFATYVTVIVLLSVVFFLRGFQLVTFDLEFALASGLRVNLYHYLMLLLVAFVVTIAVKCVGALLVYAVLIAPAAAAREISHGFWEMLAYSVAISVASTLTGISLSLTFNVSPSALIAVIASLVFLALIIASPKKRICKTCRMYRFRFKRV